MNDFATELRELIARWRDHIGTTDEDILTDLMNAIEELENDEDD